MDHISGRDAPRGDEAVQNDKDLWRHQDDTRENLTQSALDQQLFALTSLPAAQKFD